MRSPRLAPRLVSLLLAAALAFQGCALHQGPKHAATVSVVSTTAVLKAITKTEIQLVCGRPGAPQAPLCIPHSVHTQIATHMKQATIIALEVEQIVEALPTDAPTPSQVITLMVQFNSLVQEVMRLFPKGKAKTALAQQTGLPEVN